MKTVQIRSYFWFVFSCIRTRNNSVFGHFSRSAYLKQSFLYLLMTVFISLNSWRMFCNISFFDISGCFLFLGNSVMVGGLLLSCTSVCIHSTSFNFTGYVFLDSLLQNVGPKKVKVNFQTLATTVEIASHFV